MKSISLYQTLRSRHDVIAPHVVCLNARTAAVPCVQRLTDSWIVRIGYTGMLVDPKDFRLIKPSNPEAIKKYTQRILTAHRKFCGQCGAHIGGEGYVEHEGKRVDIFSINVGTLQQTEGSELDLSRWTYMYFDGRNDRVPESLRDTPYPCTIP